MFSLDKILLEFVGANWMSLYVLITLLKGMALLTKSTTDNKIVTLLSNMFSTIRGGKPVPICTPEEEAELLKTGAVAKAKNEPAPKLKETPQTSDNIH